MWHTVVVILNSDRTQAVSTLGWVDKGSLWMTSVDEESPRTVVLSDANYLSVFAGEKDHFAVVHHWDGGRLEISAHAYSNPQAVISRLSLREAISGIPSRVEILREGDLRVWDDLPGAFTGYAFGEYRLILTRHPGEEDVQTLSWFDDSYDKAYQGIVGVAEVPDSSLLIIAIQRDSHPVLYDPESQKAVRKLNLADRGGNPEFQLLAAAHEFWTADYDAIVKLDGRTLKVKGIQMVQAAHQGTRQFIGNFCFDSGQDLCFIARPFSGDAVILDANSMTEMSRIMLGRQPLDIAVLADRKLVARDWKTGDFLFHKLES